MPFASPTSLVVDPQQAHDRLFLKSLLGKLRAAGYERFVNPFAGAFSSAGCALDAGFPAGSVDCSDIDLFPSIVGYFLAGLDLAGLAVRVDGTLLDLPTEPIRAAAILLHAQLLARFEAKGSSDYWTAMVDDVASRAEEHIAGFEQSLKSLAARASGIRYAAADCWSHIEAHADDPHTVVALYPPAVSNYYDTKGRLTWDQPAGGPFDPKSGFARLHTRFAGASALLLVAEEAETRKASAPRPVFARPTAPGSTVYVLSNRPDEVFDHTGGPIVKPKTAPDFGPLARPVLPLDYDFPATATVTIQKCPEAAARYYRDLWLHRVTSGLQGAHLAVIVDGYVAGVLGLDLNMVKSPMPSSTPQMQETLMLIYGMGAPHDSHRTARLITRVGLQRAALNTCYMAWHRELVKRVITSDFTRVPEAKRLRGLMKMQSRTESADGYKLVYWAPLGEASPQECYESWRLEESKRIQKTLLPAPPVSPASSSPTSATVSKSGGGRSRTSKSRTSTPR